MVLTRMSVRLKTTACLVLFAFALLPTSATWAAGAGDDQYFDPFSGGSKSSLAKKCKKKKYKNTKKCKQYRKKLKSSK